MRSHKRSGRRGISRVAVIVIMVLVAMAVSFSALLFVGVSLVREQARRDMCTYNLKLIGLALHNYHDTYRSFPIGSRGAGFTKLDPTATQDYASSWYVGLLPFTEQIMIADRWDHEAGNGFNGGDPAAPETNMDLVNGFAPDWMRCPASPLPKLVLVGQHGTSQGRVLPTYVGIAGGVTQHKWRFHDANRARPQTGAAKGIQASNGVLIANDALRIADIRDGTTFTMMVAEQSDFHRVGPNRNKQICNSGAMVGAWSGAVGGSVVGEHNGALPVAWNVTTVRYPVQHKSYDKLPDGIFGPSDTETLGNNNGIFSAHAGGAFCLFADGRVRLVTPDTDLESLVYLCIRDDGTRIQFPD